ncbi:tetratricopeptide repeat protein, partial [Rhodopseudomonas sp. B29]|uniref:tetratricopeptide repeat protein n=1 Tax=Rhodopseudomonas sp. B29 TaxID=95607 RepID=UPI0003B4DC48
DEALAHLRQTTTRRPAFPQAFLELGNQLGKLGRLDEAAAVLEDGIALAPQLVELRVELGFISLKRNDRVRARALFEEILKAAPGRLDATIGLANTRTFDGNYAEAAELYRRALTQRPNDPALRNGLAVCLLELGDRTAGEAALRDLARNPQMASQAMLSLAGSSHGRFFLRPSAAAKFLQG